MAVVDELYKAIEHGDADHRAWLREALECFYAGKPIPAPRAVAQSWREVADDLAMELSDAITEIEGKTYVKPYVMAAYRRALDAYKTLAGSSAPALPSDGM